eukprot:TRINITY_DN70546_c0_g1_i1.p1 TRINITY_DN70546_c0_g1~~TRINITY_DN70546_c0_g1_i1.p1  ORF type:complete len:297 (+),score=58.50 TRINITY_DN70546_c0_g1_i1:90-980(+)
MAQNPADVPVPMDADDDLLATDAAAATTRDGSSSYGPIRSKDETFEADGIVFRPVEVEDVVVEAAEESGDESDEEGQEDGKPGEEGKAKEPKPNKKKAPYAKPKFAEATLEKGRRLRQIRRVSVPAHRYTPLKAAWLSLIQPLVEHMNLRVRMNTRRRTVELCNDDKAKDTGGLQKGADYVKAFMLGFDQADCVAILRLDDLFIESFEIRDVKRLQGDHLSRCIGRIAGKDGKTKYAIENATRTRISLCEDKVHVLGSFANIRLARDSICNLILGSAPGKVYTKLRTVSKRLQERI